MNLEEVIRDDVVDPLLQGRLGAGGGRRMAPPSPIPTPRAGRRVHRHVGSKDWLRDVILGGQDGLVNILGIILGVIAGGGSETVLITAGFAAAMTESISMGAVGYSSTVADRDYYLAQRAVESSAIRDDPDMEERANSREPLPPEGVLGTAAR